MSRRLRRAAAASAAPTCSAAPRPVAPATPVARYLHRCVSLQRRPLPYRLRRRTQHCCCMYLKWPDQTIQLTGVSYSQSGGRLLATSDEARAGLVHCQIITFLFLGAGQRVSTHAPNGASRAVGTHHGPTRIRLQATPSEGRYRWHYDTLSSPRLPPPALALRDVGGPQGAAGGWAPPPLPPGPQDLPRDYGPDGAAGGLKPEYTAPSGRHDHATTGAGRRVSPTTGTRSQTTCYTRRGAGRVTFAIRAKVLFI